MPRQQRSEFPNQGWLDLNLPKSFIGSLWIQVQEPTRAVAFTVIRQSPRCLEHLSRNYHRQATDPSRLIHCKRFQPGRILAVVAVVSRTQYIKPRSRKAKRE